MWCVWVENVSVSVCVEGGGEEGLIANVLHVYINFVSVLSGHNLSFDDPIS